MNIQKLVRPLDGKVGIQLSRFGIMMTDLHALMIFAKIVEANSVSEAARRLKIPTSIYLDCPNRSVIILIWME